MLKRLKDVQVNYTFLCALAYLIKTLMTTVSFSDSAIIFTLFAVVGFQKYLEFKTPKLTGIDILREEMNKANEETKKHLVEVAVVARDAKKLSEAITSKFSFNETVAKPSPQGNKRLF